MCLFFVLCFSTDSIGSQLGSGPSSPTASPIPDSEGASLLDTGSTTKDGFYLLRKDSERRTTLVKVLNEDQENVSDCGNFMQFL